MRMTLFRRPAISLLVVAVLVAGCSGNKPDETPSEAPEQGVGSIAGVVVDEAIRPVVGANVTVLVAGIAPVVASENGGFAFEGLAPGTYILSASAPGFLTVQSTATVVAGATADVRLQMPADASPVPYHTTLSYHGFMAAYAGQAQSEGQAALGQFWPGCDCGFSFILDRHPTNAVFEATWELTTPDPAGQANFGYQFLYGDDHRPIDFGGCFSPCYSFVEEKLLAPLQPGVEAHVLMTGPDAYPVVNQAFDMYLTLFYNGPAPEGWSLVNGDV